MNRRHDRASENARPAAPEADRGHPSPVRLSADIFVEAVKRHQAAEAAPAEALYRAVLALTPRHAQAAYNLGLLLQGQHRTNDAVAAYRHAIAALPDYPEAYCNLGVALQEQRRFDDAIDAYMRAIALRDDFAMAYCNMGVALKEAGRLDEAVAAHEQAIAIKPDYDFAFANLAAALLEQGRLEEATVACRRALAIQPGLALAHFNLATALKQLCRLDEAVAVLREALALKPDFVEAHFLLAQTLLLKGEFAEGWRAYEWRWQLKDYAWLREIHGEFGQPRWRGEPLEGKTILVYAEQGLGDSIQYVRYLPHLVAMGAKVILAVQPPLLKLFEGLSGVIVVALDVTPLPPFDVHCPLLSLPLGLEAMLLTPPAEVPYLTVDRLKAAHWRSRLAGHRPKVGVVWAGNPAQTGDRFRSPGLRAILPLFDVPDVSFIALQVGPGRAALTSHKLPPHVLDLGPDIADLTDTAAIMSELDLVITSCTAPLHLAGALGVPVWGLIAASPHFAWGLDREDSVWYPSLRLFRQETFGFDWSGMVSRVSEALRVMHFEQSHRSVA